MLDTIEIFSNIISQCKLVFEKKTLDYGTSWRILRTPSITDQIFIKAKRIRSIQEKGFQKVNTLNDDVISEFKGIINYCVMAIIQLKLPENSSQDLPLKEAINLYDEVIGQVLDLFKNKNHDYGEAWRDMRITSITDIILMKLLRIKQIEDNNGQTLISEGLIPNYEDIINYSVFCLIKLNNQD